MRYGEKQGVKHEEIHKKIDNTNIHNFVTERGKKMGFGPNES